jgi:3',5'-cyclic AMP phosphodiesterase CpdA
MFVLAHLSDPHLSPFPKPRWSELMGKRALGYFNWRLRRFRHHQPQALAALIHDLDAQTKDHIAVTGDLVNLALAAEFKPALTFLTRLGRPQDVTFVPGNHDAYVRATKLMHRTAWRDYIAGDAPVAPDSAEAFPFVRRRGDVALIGLTTARPTLPFLATGSLGMAQLERLAKLLPALEQEGLFRILLIHHPPKGKRSPHEVLTDATALRAVIATHGAELVLHGHDHKNLEQGILGPKGYVPLVGVPSASSPITDARPAAYNLYRIDGAPGAWSCELEIRGFTKSGEFGRLARKNLLQLVSQ